MRGRFYTGDHQTLDALGYSHYYSWVKKWRSTVGLLEHMSTGRSVSDYHGRGVRLAKFETDVRSTVSTSTAVIFALLLAFLITTEAAVQHTPNDTVSVVQLKQKNLEELMQMDITSVSKRPEKLFETPAAAQVVTQDDIRRSGATTLPEALRLAPNLGAARVDSRGWAISAGGFNGTTSNKLLVMLDGRSVYTPLYSGVFWDVQNVFLDDVERIEVISGRGGRLWAAN